MFSLTQPTNIYMVYTRQSLTPIGLVVDRKNGHCSGVSITFGVGACVSQSKRRSL